MVLGMDWLRAHDPLIHWSQNLIVFPGRQYADHTRQVCAAQVKSLIGPSLPPELTDYADVFSEKEVDQLPPHWSNDCSIDLLPDAPLPVAHLYSMSEPELRHFLAKNSARGFILPSASPLATPMLFVKKKSGELRLCCDYCKLNAITVCNRYLLPLISELLEQLWEARIFTKPDLWGVYNLVWIRAGDEWKMVSHPVWAF